MSGMLRNRVLMILSVHPIAIFLLYLEEEGKRKGRQHLLCTCHAPGTVVLGSAVRILSGVVCYEKG